MSKNGAILTIIVILSRLAESLVADEEIVVLRIIGAVLFLTWLLLVLLGKGGFVHLLLLTGIGIATVEVMTVCRSRLTL